MKDVDFPDLGIRNGIWIRNGIDFQDGSINLRLGILFEKLV